jgi:hypothetical protein
MKLLVEVTEKELKNWRKFQDSLNAQLGNVYVGTNSVCVYCDYPPELVALLHPVAGNPFNREKLDEMWAKLNAGEKLVFQLDSTKPQ